VFGVGGLAVLVLAGCMSLEQMAPPVDGTLAGFCRRGGDAEALTRGRDIYLSRCIQCHGLEPVARHSFSDWEMVIPEMADEASLNDQQEKDLTGYIFAARRFLESYPSGVVVRK
jgi:hypothetical protein